MPQLRNLHAKSKCVDSIESCGHAHGAAPQTAEYAPEEAAGARGQVEKRDGNLRQVIPPKLKASFTSAVSGESLQEEQDGSPSALG